MNIIQKYITEIVVIILFCGLGFTHYKAYKFGAEHERNIANEQLKAVHAEKTRIETEQNTRYQLAQTGYAGALDTLNARLRVAEALPRRTSMSVAGSSSNQGSMPGTSEDTSGTFTALKTYPGTAGIDFYQDSLRDNIQCQTLIDFLKTQPH